MALAAVEVLAQLGLMALLFRLFLLAAVAAQELAQPLQGFEFFMLAVAVVDY
jgi:hypothetical protein